MPQVKVKVVVDRLLEPLNAQQMKIVEQFERYKQESLIESPNNFVCPHPGVQMAYPSAHPSFGRDIEFERPDDLINDIIEYRLSKVHLDTRAKWKPYQKQWKCTSNESVVYSGFLMPCDTRCFVIIDFLINAEGVEEGDAGFDAHEHYSDQDIDEYLDAAAENRDEILGNG